MRITLLTGYSYDLSDEEEFRRLKKNISVMSFRKQFDRLTDISRQVAPYQHYDGKEVICLHAREIYALTAAYAELSTAAKPAATTSTVAAVPAASAPASSVTGITAGAGVTVSTTPPRAISIRVFSSPPSDKIKKEVEKPAKTSSPRSNKTAYADNLTAALLMPEAFKVAGDPVETLKRARDLLVEHAARRVDLAFYLMVAYYKTRIILNIDETTSQHGMGSKETVETNACHSALISTVEELFRLKPIASYAERLSRDKAEAITKPCLAKAAHFKNTLSMTTELPRGVNYYDVKLEGKLGESGRSEVRKLLLTVLNEVSCGEHTPFQALKIFFIALKNFFSDLEKSAYLDESSKTSPAALKKLAHAAQLQGTFKDRCSVFIHEGKTHAYVVPEYPASLLRLKPEDFARVSDGVTSEKEIEAIFELYYGKLQEEMGVSVHDSAAGRAPVAGTAAAGAGAAPAPVARAGLGR